MPPKPFLPPQGIVLRRAVLILVLGLSSAAARAQFHPEAVPGGVADIPVAPSGAARPEVRFQDKPVLLQSRKDGWHALVGLPLDLPPGEHALAVGAGESARQLSFAVQPKAYPEQHLRIANPRMVNPEEEDLARINRERDEQLRVRSQFRQVAVEGLDLDLPAAGRKSSNFGLRRVFNGEARAPHSGLDVAVPTGTPVRAPADGVVSLLGDYFFNGRAVFVDHGQGLVSMVCHLDKADVKLGQSVRRGELIGRSGSSGRATGPHLHWSVYLNGVAVNPALFIAPAPKR